MKQLLQNWVTRQADRRPDAPALVLQPETLTYSELERRSNQLARALKEAGCQPGDRVGLLLPKSIPAVVGMIGSLKADCIYVPLDAASPAPRLRSILDSCEARCVLAGPSTAELLSETLAGREGLAVGWMSAAPSTGLAPAFTWSDVCSLPEGPLDYTRSESDTVHILFTSGSTGAPKGVPITHDNINHFIGWATRYFGFAPEDRISGHPPLHFDLSTFDVYGSFLAGSQLWLVTPEMSLLPHKLAEFIRRAELTQWFSVPSLLNYMAKFDVVRQDDFPALKRLLWCGERFPTPGLIYWMTRLPRVQFTNLYGPTEATIASSYYTVPECPRDENAAIPIGTACPGEELLVLNDDLQPTPAGETGQLFISGVGLSPGYWRDAEKTRGAFFEHAGERIYRTGDLASLGPDGLVYLHGRADSQIKSRGYRIELGEIETALHSMNDLRESAVVAVERAGFEGLAICCAYVPVTGMEITSQQLNARLGALLPHYMIPVQWMALEAMPLNANGKIDRPKLRQWFQAENKLSAVSR